MQKYDRSFVSGFLKTAGRKIVNGDGREILLTGVGFGNWLLPEGYMWKFGSPRADRPRRIEAVFTELLGKKAADRFWKKFRENYITEKDIAKIANEGYNSVRIPINWRILMEEGPGVVFIEEGFKLLENCVKWCEKYGLYVFLDLHGAPGGQTGANIDDSVDDVPRLFIDEDSREKTIALWCEIAKRYKDRWIIGGYDLLNEPLPSEKGDYTKELMEFYKDCVKAIREIDKIHLFSLEGAHWATNLSIFNEKFDDGIVLHFHRYWLSVENKCIEGYLAKSLELDVPLWMGESGENSTDWFSGMYNLLLDNNISWNFWPWKKMDTSNTPCSIKTPKDWDMILNYIKGGKKPSYEKAQEILNEYIENIKFDSCQYHEEVVNAMFRRAPLEIPAVYYDFKGRGISCDGIYEDENPGNYRENEGIKFVLAEEAPAKTKNELIDNKLAVDLTEESYVEYTVKTIKPVTFFALIKSENGKLAVSSGDSETVYNTDSKKDYEKIRLIKAYPTDGEAVLRLKTLDGSIFIKRIFAEYE